jgi:hypothetical protein
MGNKTWAELFPEGRGICYEGDDPEGFVAEILAEFGFDPSADPAWRSNLLSGGYDGGDVLYEDPFGRSYWFHCPPEHLDAIYTSDRWPMGS